MLKYNIKNKYKPHRIVKPDKQVIINICADPIQTEDLTKDCLQLLSNNPVRILIFSMNGRGSPVNNPNKECILYAIKLLEKGTFVGKGIRQLSKDCKFYYIG